MLTVFLMAFVLVMACVGVHYNVLVLLSDLFAKHGQEKRWLINVLIIGALLTHILEMSLFAAGYALLHHWKNYGAIHDGAGTVSTDYWYFSFVVYTSLGFGDLTPSGALRMLTAIETLTGLVLIAWTASFLFVEMQKWATNSPSHEQQQSNHNGD